jgi:hypothetical protein
VFDPKGLLVFPLPGILLSLVLGPGAVFRSSAAMDAGMVLFVVWSVAATISVHRKKWRESRNPSVIANICMFPLVLFWIVHWNVEIGLAVRDAVIRLLFSK